MNDKGTWLWIALIVLLLGLRSGCNINPGPPAPIRDAGLRVLITYDEANRGNLPTGQKRILDSTALRAWLDAHCTTADKGGHGWRIWPDSADASNDDPVMAKLLAVAKDKNEWLVVSDGNRGTSQALPPDEPALMTVLEPYGGGK